MKNTVKIKVKYEAPFLSTHMMMISRLYREMLTKKMEHLDIDRYYSLLLIIDDSDNSFTQQQLCDHLKLNKASMVRIIDYLNKKGYINRGVNPDDRREHILILTTKAKKNLPKIRAGFKELDKIITHGMNKNQVTDFYSWLHKAKENLKNKSAPSMVVQLKK